MQTTSIMPHTEQRKRTHEFIKRWTNRGYEKGESQTFWLDLLSLLGVESPADFIRFESQVRLDHTSFIDGFIETTHVLIEQKSLGKDLRSPIKQSDGTLLNPFQQAKRYAAELPYSERPRWIVTCNFAEFLVYDMEQPNGEPASIRLKDLEKELYRLSFLVKTQDATLQREMELSLKAGELVGRLYDALLVQYLDSTSPHTLHSLNALCVRLVFCLYAEDAGLFGSHTAFHDFLASFHPDNVRDGLIKLFRMLDTPVKERDPYERRELLAFPYVNGGLFRDEKIEIPRFTPAILHLLLTDCSADFNWSGISPTIFGAVFESTLNPETRRSGGMHYTSIENIHKVIDPLFLNDLTESFDQIERIAQSKKRNAALIAFQNRLASLRFLDPACGSGNFLTETFLSLRRLENRALKLLYGTNGERSLGGDFSPIKVSISQFYGIEINDFAATVAKTALWIAESQMMQETEDIVGRDLNFLPLKTYTNITEGNALRLDWRKVIGAATPSSPHSSSIGLQTSNIMAECGDEASPLLWQTNKEAVNFCERVSPLPITQEMYFDRKTYARITASGNRLPHWQQDGKLQFITFRLADSLPQVVLNDLKREKEEWLKQHPKPWNETTETEYWQQFVSTIDRWLDAGHGSCVLRDNTIAATVEESLRYLDGVQYNLVAYVVMPNHVHVLAQILPNYDITKIVQSWKSVSAHKINKALHLSKTLWQKEYFDRMIRGEEHLSRTIRYIEQNHRQGGITIYSPYIGAATSPSPHNGSIGLQTSNIIAGCGDEASPLLDQSLFIMGNPPFVGYSLQSKEQKADILSVFVDERGKPYKTAGKIDYVAGWYYKAAEMIQGTSIRCAFVSTNSITQGEQVASVWRPLFDRFHIHIDFAHRTFRWDSEASLKAHVHCIVVGFSSTSTLTPYHIYEGETKTEARNINAYLIDAPNVFVESRTKALCPVPPMVYGNKPVDGGFLFLTETERREALRREPQSAKFIHRILGSEEYINNKPRYCYWLVGAKPAEIRACPMLRKRVEGVRAMRLASTKAATRQSADTPTLFQEIRQPSTNYIIVPRVSSERSRYIPIGFVTPDIIVNDSVQIIPNATLYHFGVLTSNVHMAWMRAVCGRLEMRYRYSKDVVYNNFPWPNIGAATPSSPYNSSIDTQANNVMLGTQTPSSPPRGTGNMPCLSPNKGGIDISTNYNAAECGDGASPLLRVSGNANSGHTQANDSKNEEMHKRIEQTAQGILDARAKYPDESLANLYDETLMPAELRKAHQANDRAVMQAYGFPIRGFTEADCVAALMRMYQELIR